MNWLDTLDTWDRALFLTLNGLHTTWLDPIMWYISGKWTWVPLYLALAAGLVWHTRGRWYIYLLPIVPLITCSDQLASGVAKPLVARVRPCNVPELKSSVHIVNGYCSGAPGFFSSHAANALALATYLCVLFGRRYKALAFSLYAWALLVSYSRIYLGVHYPGDILAGVVTGAAWGLLFAYLAKRWALTKADGATV